jgi:glucose/arabinose dehydrogenase
MTPALRRRLRPGWIGLLLLALALPCALGYFAFGLTPTFVVGAIRAALQPEQTLAGIAVPNGVRVTAWAEGLSAPTSLTFGPDGRLYVSELSGNVVALADTDGDGAADSRVVFATGFSAPLGLAFFEADLYVGRREGVTRVRDTDGDGVADDYHVLLEGLPAGRHQTDGIAFGPDGRMYIGQGSTSDRGETGVLTREASILVAERDGSGLRVFASGTRNPYDLAFYPGTDFLFATDNGRDVPATGVPEELNLIVDGGAYGWPDCWGTGQGTNCTGTSYPIAEFQGRSSANGLMFYTGDLFPEWQRDAFVTLYGALSGDPGIGRKVQRVALTQAADGTWRGAVSDFATGLDRPLDVVTGPDGAIYVADYGAGAVYRFGK